MPPITPKKTPAALSAVLKIVAPMAKKHITPDTLSSLYDSMTAPYADPFLDERVMLVVSKKRDGQVVGSIVGVDSDNHIRSQYQQMPLNQLIEQLLKIES